MASKVLCDELHVNLTAAVYTISTMEEGSSEEYVRDYCHDHYRAVMERLMTGGVKANTTYSIYRTP